MAWHDVDRSKLYELIRKQIEREDELIYHRTYWLLTTQTILFAAYTLALSATATSTACKPDARQYMIWFLLWFTPGVGLVVSCVNFIATLAALEKIGILRQFYTDWHRRLRNDMPLPGLTSDSFISFCGALPARTLAPLFFVVWALVLWKYYPQVHCSGLMVGFIALPFAASTWAIYRHLVMFEEWPHKAAKLTRVLGHWTVNVVVLPSAAVFIWMYLVWSVMTYAVTLVPGHKKCCEELHWTWPPTQLGHSTSTPSPCQSPTPTPVNTAVGIPASRAQR